ncbi:hypothetical protein LIER_37861 [Lithospermum erythrorhizon]|uniref:Retrotransposon gag domain-containing protein n=1 Tax=Lithospermum erythrorhizon TaxID=34254 RepID=A0AAV3PTD0_LITER
MPFTARLNGVHIPVGFILPQFTQYSGIRDPQKHLKDFLAQMTITTNDMDIYAKAFPNRLTGAALDWYMELLPDSIDSYAHTADAFIFKYNTSIANKQDERTLMDLQQFTRESLRDFHERYKAILNNIPSIDNKIAYMAFYRELNYGKLKKALVLETPLRKDDLTKMVNKHIDLENLQRKEGPSGDLREKLSRKDNQGHSEKPIWDRLRDMGQSFRKRAYSPPRRELVHCAQPISQQPMAGQIPLRVAISDIYSQMANK